MFVFGESFSVCRQQFCSGHLFPISNIIISDTRGAVLLDRSHLGEPRYTLPPFPLTILNSPNQEFRHNGNSYNTIQTQEGPRYDRTETELL